MFRALLVLFSLLMFTSPIQAADNGLITVKSPYSVNETLDRFEKAVAGKGMTVFARVDHAKGATGVDLELRPTQLLIFGNPKIGTLLMQSKQTAGIDLPLKLLAWKAADGQVWIAYNDPGYLVQRHNISDRDKVVTKMRKALAHLAATATGK